MFHILFFAVIESFEVGMTCVSIGICCQIFLWLSTNQSPIRVNDVWLWSNIAMGWRGLSNCDGGGGECCIRTKHEIHSPPSAIDDTPSTNTSIDSSRRAEHDGDSR